MQISYVEHTEILNKTLLVMGTIVYLPNEKARTKTLCYTRYLSIYPTLFKGSSFLCKKTVIVVLWPLTLQIQYI